ncbi:family 16 glycoside hydrolase [Hymenobacter sp. YC55]|uniref:family 16 glycoside hydrolase n=1 Tax=Hymenobacter sp. YC55 TaxID=3034019 RepID=UPI0023F89CD9|nr:family 16 glycoside hydrolase [Hymenobacter sp. YC55]MDF7811319.1 hypothetical protein [Hymenobacter sp. YC55]
MKSTVVAFFLVLISLTAQSQAGKRTFALDDTTGLTAVRVQMEQDTYLGKKSVKVLDTAQGITSELKYAKVRNVPFHNGTIEVELAGQPLSTAVETARGFVGIAFRVDETDTKFECLYLRPTNGRAEDQVRRNHSSQYISHPDFPWQKLRKESPEKYEAYVDLEVGKWTKVRIVVKDSTAKLYVHGATQPTLIVSDLKHGPAHKGVIGLWIGSGTEAHFRNLVVTPAD